MILSYLPVSFHLEFDKPVYADVHPLFILRSVLGKNLREMSCIAENQKCINCMYNKACNYAFLFETILPQQNDVVPGRNRASHPFAFTKGENGIGKKISDYNFTITLFGKAIDYLQYIYKAFYNAGVSGLFKSRTPFHIKECCAGKQSILQNGFDFDAINAFEWKYNSESKICSGETLIELKTPLRFKINGKYKEVFTVKDFMHCLYRRTATLCSLYGDSAMDFSYYADSTNLKITDLHLRWEDNCHYSARQKDSISLGGVEGSFRLSGNFTAGELSLLELGKIANAGKNTNFGLGQMDYWFR